MKDIEYTPAGYTAMRVELESVQRAAKARGDVGFAAAFESLVRLVELVQVQDRRLTRIENWRDTTQAWIDKVTIGLTKLHNQIRVWLALG